MKKIYLIFIPLLFILTACNSKTLDKNAEFDFFSSELSTRHGERVIIDIKAKFSECGEWGGHEEKIFITTREDKEFYLKYELYCADCDSMVLYKDSIGSFYTPLKTLVDSGTMKMQEEHKLAIYDFTQNLVQAKFREEYSGHSGNSFEINKHEGFGGTSFQIYVYGYDSQILFDYFRLTKKVINEDRDKIPCVQYLIRKESVENEN